jgi:dolichol kinase
MSALLGLCAITFVIIDLGRSRHIWISKIFRKYFNGMMRTHELDGKLTGASYVLIGSFITVTLFPRYIAVLALLFASFGDTLAALYGKKFGKIKIWNKTLEGTIAGIIACILVAQFIPEVSNIVKYSGAFAAMFIELMPIRIDDNLRIPLFSGIIMDIVLFFL